MTLTINDWIEKYAKKCESNRNPIGACEELPDTKDGFDQIPEPQLCSMRACPKLIEEKNHDA